LFQDNSEELGEQSGQEEKGEVEKEEEKEYMLVGV
jgi:hypothetical protein